MISFLKLIRYKNLLMVLLTLVLTKYALIDSFESTSYFSNFQFSIISVSILCITAGGYIINDIIDLKADKINKPDKVFIDQTITKQNAIITYLLFSIIGLVLGSYLSFQVSNPMLSFIFIGTIIGLYLYSKVFKRLALIGNLITSFFISLVIITLYIFESNLPKLSTNLLDVFINIFESITTTLHVFFYAFFAFLITFIREMIKDIEDINGDYAMNMKTLPILIGVKRAKSVVFIVTIFTFCFLILALKEIFSNTLLFVYSFTFVLIPFAWFLYKLRITQHAKQYHQISSALKLIMVFGIVSMLIFKFQ